MSPPCPAEAAALAVPLNDALRRYKIEREEIQTRALAGCRVQARRKAGRRIEEEVREDLA